MAYYESDEALAELHDELYADEEQAPKTGFSKLDDTSKFWAALFVGALLLLIMFNKIDTKQGLIVGGIGLVILYLMRGTSTERKELTWLECMVRIYDLLDFLQKHHIGPYEQIPQGEIQVTPIGRKQWYEGKSFKRSFGVKIKDKMKNITEIYYVELDIFIGDIITFREAPEGVRGDETKDIKYIPSPNMLMEKRRKGFLGLNKKEVQQ